MNAKFKGIIPSFKVDLSKARSWLIFSAKILATIIILGPLITAFTYHLAYANRIYPGVKVGQLSLGNRIFEEAVALTSAYFQRYDGYSLSFNTDKGMIEIPFGESGLSYQASETAQLAFDVGREGNPFHRIKEKWLAWHYGEAIDPAVHVDEAAFGDTLDYLSHLVDDPGTSTVASLVYGEVNLVPPKPGISLDREAFREEVLTAVKNFSFDSFEVPMRKISPLIDEEGIKDARDISQRTVDSSIRLTYEGRSWTPGKEELLTFLAYESVESTASAEKGVLKVSASRAKIGAYVAEIARGIDQEPLEERFQLKGERLASFQPAQNGLKLNQEKAIDGVGAALLDSSLPREIVLEVVVTPPPPAPEINPLGIKDLLGEGITNFRGSAAGRIDNIVLASSRLNGILIGPGEEFSFNHYLGEVEKETGYSSAYVIKEGRTVLGTGGGVCQVSTTLFRAALNAGLPVLKRTAHAYRVHYYEPPVGFDATVYAPSVDLVFRNNTPGHILIQSYAYPSSTTLIFRIYGTDDGRNVTTQGPFIAWEKPPPEPEYVDDPTLPKGEIKQIDWAAWGADVTMKRTVVRNGETLSDDTFRSIYQPWKAVYLRGTKE